MKATLWSYAARLRARLKRLLWGLPGGRWLIHVVEEHRFKGWAGNLSRREIFARHYETNWWGDSETRSGGGATVAYTANIRGEIPRLVADLGVKSILDAPCGDYNWFRHIALPEGVTYIGADIVPALVDGNRRRYARPGVSFVELDIVNDPLPAADLWLCRAALIHFSTSDIWSTFENYLRSRIPWLLTTSLPDARTNRDTATGFFRSLNLEAPPFRFPRPLREIADGVSADERIALCLWPYDVIAAALATNPAFQSQRARARVHG